MSRWEAPGKLNLSLLVHPPRPDGYHPIESMVQTVDWVDLLFFEDGDNGTDLVVSDDPEIDPEDNLVLRALAAVREAGVVLPPRRVILTKTLPVAAGLGGGSSNAAATVAAVGRAFLEDSEIHLIAAGLGADVPLFLTGGTLLLEGVGDLVRGLPGLSGFSVAVVVPRFGLDTAEVYRAWDRLQGPVGEELPESGVPPPLRGGMPLRNDLLPAAIQVEPDLAEFMAEVRAAWGSPVGMTGSGSACFGYFATPEEAADAAAAVAHLCRQARGVSLRPSGVTPLPDDPEQESDHG